MKKEIIYTEHYALIVSKLTSPAKEGQVFLSKENIIHTVVGWNFADRLIIAHQPLTDAPILEGVPLLPEFGQEDDVLKVVERIYPTKGWLDCDETIDSIIHKQIAFGAGYNKAKETYKYTEEDLISFHKWAFQKVRIEESDKNTKELLDEWQSIKQPKRFKYFECEIEYIHDVTVPYPKTLGTKPKTIINSKGQTELVGEYIYE
jgi:uncharacterized protein YabN with tetrapyrrole methylase and pyrophosphatase domain